MNESGTGALALLFDADDTLWENAVFFARALESFCAIMSRQGIAEERTRALFAELEARGFRRRWYGSRRLEINLRAAARRLLDGEVEGGLAQELRAIAGSVSGHEIRIFDAVPEVLDALSRRHRLFLVTMGESQEQGGKIERSGLARHFEAIHVLHDKTRAAFEEIIRRHRLARRSTWMIGNSLAKDIRPARAAGLKTVHLANGQDFGFGLPDTGIQADLVVRSFAELARSFGVGLAR